MTSFVSLSGNAYPDFMSYGYNSCLVCHYNGTGGGPLNDYGRSLFAVEIAAKPFFQNKLSDEQLSAMSGFLGEKKIPLDLKPYLKFRYLGYNSKFDKKPTQVEKEILMQASLGTTYILDQNDKYLLNFEVGYAPTPQAADKNKKEQTHKLISREYYFRWNYTEESWLYFGFFDKPFGIKSPDHSSYSRSYIGFGQNDQAHGVMLHKVYNSSEWFVNTFVGNLLQSSDLRLIGLSSLYEYEVSNSYRVGGSVFYAKNDYVNQLRLSHHQKYSPSKGHILLYELGYFNDLSVVSSSTLHGIYSALNLSTLISRGINFTTQFELINDNLTNNNSIKTKSGIGLLYFPMQRIELRTSIINNRIFTSSTANEDTFTWLGQIHLSL